jgi:hypothetical protein
MSTRPERIRELLPSGRSKFLAMRYGIEMEFEGMEITQSDVPRRLDGGYLPHWMVVRDGSLRNGVEFISDPLVPHVVERELAGLYALSDSYELRSSARSGMHIHCNMAGRSVQGLAQVLAAYTLAEPALFSMAGETREQNIYCVPWFHDPDVYSHVEDLVRVMATFDRGSAHYHDVWGYFCKYSALNLLPLKTQHTIEFRHLQTPHEATGAVWWWRAINALVSRAGAITSAPDMPAAVMAELGPIIGLGHASKGRDRADEEGLIIRAQGILDALSCTYKAPDWGVPCGLYPNANGRVRNVRNLGNRAVENFDDLSGEEVPNDVPDSGISTGQPRRRDVPTPARPTRARPTPRLDRQDVRLGVRPVGDEGGAGGVGVWETVALMGDDRA